MRYTAQLARLAPTAALVLAVAGNAPAQTIGYNEVIRFGTVEVVQSSTNSSTGYNLEATGAQPAGFATSSGVAAGTLTWVWYPSLLNARFTDRFVTGYAVAVRPSTATPKSAYSSGSGVALYIPKFAIWPAKARPKGTGTKPAFGWGYDPDLSKKPLFQDTTSRSYFETRPDASRIWTVTYGSKIKIPGSSTSGPNNEIVLSAEWKGGESISKSGAQSIPSGFSENEFKPVHWGFGTTGTSPKITYFDPTKTVPGLTTRVYSSPFLGYFEDEPTIAFHSDWGELRDPNLKTSVYPSYNPGSGLSDLGSVAGAAGFDVYTSTSHAGFRCLPLLNVASAPQGVSTKILGQVVEVNLANPFVAFAWNNTLLDGVIDKDGVFLPTKRVALPKLGTAAIGTWIGMEYVIANPKTGAIVGTTPALWFYIQK